MTAVWPSREIDCPGRGGDDRRSRAGRRPGSARRRASAPANGGSPTVCVVASARRPSARTRRGRRSCWSTVSRACDRLGAGGLPAGARERVLDPRREEAEADGDDHPRDGDEPEVRGRPAAEPADRSERRFIGGRRPRGRASERRPKSRSRTSDAGQAPTTTYSHWLTPTKAVSSRNHGETSAASSALSSVTVPASANSTRSSGQPARGRRRRRAHRRRPLQELRRARRSGGAGRRRPARTVRRRRRRRSRSATKCPSFVAADDAGLREHAEVLGDVLLGGAERLGQLADGRGALA